MSPVRRGTRRDVAIIAKRVGAQLASDAHRDALVSGRFSRREFEDSLARADTPVWVVQCRRRIRGHLYGATLDDSLHGRQTWSGPDGYTYDSPMVLDELLSLAREAWREDGSRAHHVWALAGPAANDWTSRGYHAVSVRGTRVLHDIEPVEWSRTEHVRLASRDDLPRALELDQLIDVAHGLVSELLTSAQREETEADLLELLEDPENSYYFLEVDGQPVAQCVTYRMPELRGTFEDTLYVGSLAVADECRRRGLATKLVHHVLTVASQSGYRYAEARWHLDNLNATSLWHTLGFRPTYVQLRRSLSD